MSNRTAEANKAITAAWKQEADLIRQGQGTRDWTPKQQADIMVKGKAFDENGKAFEGHHMKSVEEYPEYQGDANNIQFLSRAEHLAAHDGYFGNPTNGYYDPATMQTTQFEEGDPSIDAVPLQNPIDPENAETIAQLNDLEQDAEGEDALSDAETVAATQLEGLRDDPFGEDSENDYGPSVSDGEGMSV